MRARILFSRLTLPKTVCFKAKIITIQSSALTAVLSFDLLFKKARRLSSILPRNIQFMNDSMIMQIHH